MAPMWIIAGNLTSIIRHFNTDYTLSRACEFFKYAWYY